MGEEVCDLKKLCDKLKIENEQLKEQIKHLTKYDNLSIKDVLLKMKNDISSNGHISIKKRILNFFNNLILLLKVLKNNKRYSFWFEMSFYFLVFALEDFIYFNYIQFI